ncbi:two-component system sensor histidine kinase NtrB [Persephonella sp.]
MNNPENILESIEDPIIVLTFNGEILYSNQSAEQLRAQLGKKAFYELITYPLTLKHIKNRVSVKSIFKEINKNNFLIDAFPYGNECVTLLIRDITRFIELEENTKKEGWIATISKLISNIFHDMKGPIGGIKGSAQLLKEDPTDQELIEDILYEVKRLESMINDVTLITKPIKLQREKTNIHQLIDRTIKSLQSQYPEIEFKRVYDPSLPDIELDREYMLRVLINIIRNGIEAVEGKGVITIFTGISWDNVYSPKGDKMFVRIKDSGKGVPEEMLDKLFVPFASTKKGGMGIGLSSSYKIVKEHGGILRYIGNATFEILLPYKE